METTSEKRFDLLIAFGDGGLQELFIKDKKLFYERGIITIENIEDFEKYLPILEEIRKTDIRDLDKDLRKIAKPTLFLVTDKKILVFEGMFMNYDHEFLMLEKEPFIFIDNTGPFIIKENKFNKTHLSNFNHYVDISLEFEEPDNTAIGITKVRKIGLIKSTCNYDIVHLDDFKTSKMVKVFTNSLKEAFQF